jgi:hypothetical protein
MNHLPDATEGTNTPSYFPVLGQQDGHNPILISPSLTLLDPNYVLHTPYDPHFVINPATTAASTPVPIFISPATTLTTAIAVGQFNLSSSMNARRTKKAHPCQQCKKPFARRALAEGCENRHRNEKPFQCRGRCGNLNWWVVHFSPQIIGCREF